SDDLNHEVLVMGCGIGYLKKMGMEIDPQKIDKIYRLQSKQALSNLETLFTGLPLATIQATNDIVDYAKTSLGTQLSDNIYLTLADHIQFAIEREKEGLIIKNALLWEIKQFYHHEFMIGQESLEIIQQKLKINLPEDEAAFIALHLVSATQDYSGTSQAKQTMTMIKQVLSII
ncbi:MAG: PRD domain-containing protein, partial [Lactococcus sp.]|nr:PRD domain-containing protein [Lactococcus sp.]